MMRVTIESPVPTLKSVQGVTVIKRSELFVTAGTEFANRKDIREAIEAGERGEVQPLPWGVWVQYPFIIGHTPKSTGEYTEYIRLFPPTQAQLQYFNLAPKVQFTANGAEVTREQAIEYCGAKAKANEEQAETFSVSAANVVSIT